MEVLDLHKSKFGLDFVENKKILDQIAIIRSKGLKNEIAGYITKLIKHEINDKKIKEEQHAKQEKLTEPIEIDSSVEASTETPKESDESIKAENTES